jgi:hypothetical protein
MGRQLRRVILVLGEVRNEAMSVRVGLDFGGVIVKPRDRQTREDTTLDGSDGIELAHEGVFEAVRDLVSYTSGAVWIVSKAGPKMQSITRDWLDAVDFYSQTGLERDNLRFCLERPEKETICRSLAITHFVDDRFHIMQILRHCVPNLFLFGAEDGRRFCRRFCPPWASFVTNWSELVNHICRFTERR